MKIELTNGIESLTLDTQILWFVELETPQSFDEILTGVLENLKKRGFNVLDSFSNVDGWSYISANLPKGEEILSKNQGYTVILNGQGKGSIEYKF
jgi:hypothetical protein